jgi:hypothetical protein
VQYPPGTVECKICRGLARSMRTGNQCATCDGLGFRPLDPTRTVECRLCSGLGFSVRNGNPCTNCDGYGMIAPPIFAPPVTMPPTLPDPDDNEQDVLFIKGRKPWTAQRSLQKVFENVSGELRICDPYYGRNTLVSLDLLKHCKPIKFLTKNADSRETQTITSTLQLWKSEHGDVEFRKTRIAICTIGSCCMRMK